MVKSEHGDSIRVHSVPTRDLVGGIHQQGDTPRPQGDRTGQGRDQGGFQTLCFAKTRPAGSG
jgi:hypothetical protein